jgi:hypothetical protein
MAEVEETKTPQKQERAVENTETAVRGTTAMQSEVTSAMAAGKGEEGSVKSLKRQKVDEAKAVTPKVSP